MKSITRAELTRLLLARGATVRRHPTLAPRDRERLDADPTMAPTKGLTPAITTPGPKTYLYACQDKLAFAEWNDDRPRVPVTWLTWDEWRRLWLSHDAASEKRP